MSRNCYDCSSIHDGEGCYNINSTSEGLELLDYNQFVKKCPGEQPYCKVSFRFMIDIDEPEVSGVTLQSFQVYRVEYLLMDDYKSKDDGPYTPWSIERSCSSECKNFCVTMGGRTKITYCTSCCVGDLCNTDNSSPSLSMYPLTHSILILAVMRVLFQ